MIIRNKYLNIYSEDVNSEIDIFKLKTWLLEIEENIMTLGITLERSSQDTKWVQKTKTARKYQIILKGQIQNIISYLKSQTPYEQVLIDLLKEKVSLEDWLLIETKAKQLINGNSYSV